MPDDSKPSLAARAARLMRRAEPPASSPAVDPRQRAAHIALLTATIRRRDGHGLQLPGRRHPRHGQRVPHRARPARQGGAGRWGGRCAVQRRPALHDDRHPPDEDEGDDGGRLPGPREEPDQRDLRRLCVVRRQQPDRQPRGRWLEGRPRARHRPPIARARLRPGERCQSLPLRRRRGDGGGRCAEDRRDRAGRPLRSARGVVRREAPARRRALRSLGGAAGQVSLRRRRHEQHEWNGWRRARGCPAGQHRARGHPRAVGSAAPHRSS